MVLVDVNWHYDIHHLCIRYYDSRNDLCMNHADHSTFEHLIHMFFCCIAGIGIGTLAVWGYQKIKDNKNHNP